MPCGFQITHGCRVDETKLKVVREVVAPTAAPWYRHVPVYNVSTKSLSIPITGFLHRCCSGTEYCEQAHGRTVKLNRAGAGRSNFRSAIVS